MLSGVISSQEVQTANHTLDPSPVIEVHMRQQVAAATGQADVLGSHVIGILWIFESGSARCSKRTSVFPLPTPQPQQRWQGSNPMISSVWTLCILMH